MKKYVYAFNEGTRGMVDLLGVKGANLAEMTQSGMRVPFGFTITTRAVNDFFEDGKKISEEMLEEILASLSMLESVTKKKFGDMSNPLVLSIRSSETDIYQEHMDPDLNVTDFLIEKITARFIANPGAAVVVQEMVEGDFSGFLYTRDPEDGSKFLIGEYGDGTPLITMADELPECYDDLEAMVLALEKHYGEMLFVDFAVKNNKPYIIKMVAGERTPLAALRIACDLEAEGIIDRKTAVLRVSPRDLDKLVNPEGENAQAVDLAYFQKFMKWTDEFKTLKVRANTNTAEDAEIAMNYGAEGIGLARCEYIFSENSLPDTIRRQLHDTLLEMFIAMGDNPVNIRLLSHSGTRIDVTRPEVTKIQTEVILRTAIEAREITKLEIRPEIMIPLVSLKSEFSYVKGLIDEAAKKVFEETGETIDYLVGTMIETPRAALIADELADEAEFFSFGTNDLTELTFGFDGYENDRIIGDYLSKGLLKADPFKSIDMTGVARLVKMAAQLGRDKRPTLKLGICGEQVGDAQSVDFCAKAGLNYISCEPYKVPMARLSAAQTAILSSKKQS